MYAVLGRGARPTRAKGVTRWKLTASKAVGLDPAMETKVACTSTSGGFDRRLAQPILQGVPVQLDALAGIMHLRPDSIGRSFLNSGRTHLKASVYLVGRAILPNTAYILKVHFCASRSGKLWGLCQTARGAVGRLRW